ncbi:DUF2306 domain-containing protein [Glycomyces algeriensis]|uniref:Uncharacterized protein n=1 Tax=Glycomyces algeriensis TaxID=256037 RepID=A0A9W6LFE9_9ACTN|nr:DUF2306 domain-containing protein [Glycomyces algeriensis]MDA1366041.1 DUF2306 domain-containing protein [Glycomyces algeriensis]MDR7349192.1 putative membrane protein [Glycomyces algeriensis]GLI41892.1 hypothetical protein GALLR39Z86_17420 [Glycomyces algeriensis]
MSATLTVPKQTPPRRGRIAVVVVAIASVAIVLSAVPPYLAGVEPRVDIRENVPVHLPLLIAHAAAGGIALLVGPFQFFGSIRRNHPKVHRTLGRVYLLGGILPGALTGIVVAVLTTAGPIALVSFVLLDVFWLYSAWRAYRAVRSRDFAAHERWMLRSMAATFAAVMLRVYLGLFIAVQLPLLEGFYDGDFEALFSVAYTGAIVGSIVLNLLFIEIYLRRKANRRISAGAP